MNLREKVYLVGTTSHQLFGSKLPSNKQVLSVLFHNLRNVKLSLRDSSRLVIDETFIFWQKARIPTREARNCVTKIESMYEEWRKLQKNANRRTEVQIKRENEFTEKFDDLFDISHANALDLMKIDLDKQFLIQQRQKGRPGSLIGVDLTAYKKETKRRKQFEDFENKRKRSQYEIQKKFESVEIESSSDSDENIFEDDELDNARAPFEETLKVVSEADN